MRSEKVGVIIACYNQGRTVGEAVASLVSQSHSCWEAVLVDDASTDGCSPDLCRAVESEKVRVFLENSNRGRSSVRRFALSHLRPCRYVLVLDADDFLAPDYLALLVAALGEQPDAGIAYGTLHFFFDDDPLRGIIRTWPEHGFIADSFLLKEHVPGPGVLFRRDLLDKIDPWRKDFDLTSAEDEDMTLQVYEAGQRLLWVPEAAYHYRQHAESFLSSATLFLRVLAKVRILRRHKKTIRDHSGLAAFFDRWIGPPWVGMVRAGHWREAVQIALELFPAAPSATLAWLAKYYGRRIRHRTLNRPC